jgi:cytochrome c-type biogenesis protein
MVSSSFLFALIAGVLSSLSPCVLPLLPVVLGTAVSEHRFGPAALAVGLALSFVAIGMFIATIGFGIGADAALFRKGAAVLLIAAGLVLMVPRFQVAFSGAAGPLSNWADTRFGGFQKSGLSGQFWLGLLLGAVWSPCVGPTLGAASVLASQGRDLGQVALVMASFGVGAALPLLLLGTLSRQTLLAWRSWMMSAGSAGKIMLGGLLLVVGVAILTGLDKHLEAALVAASPEWLTELTTRF